MPIPTVPFFGRLRFRDYLSIVFTIGAFLLEGIFRALVLLLIPFPAVGPWLRRSVSKVFPNIFKPLEQGERESVLHMLSYWGYPCETHVAHTEDGYLLGLQRIAHGTKGAVPEKKSGKPVVLLWHGFMMNSEVWVCGLEEKRNLPLVLANAGYDVWLGNTRGNKYSYKHVKLKPNSAEFWDFSIDEFALYDLPAAVDYILCETGLPSLTYIGFSQATAQCFGALSLHHELNSKINLFIALAPATRPKDLRNGTVQAFIKASPNIIYLFLGRKRALSATLFWQSVLTREAYVRVIDAAVKFLFGWGDGSMSFEDRETCYRHLYSFTSVKSVVHWFQIIRTGFRMYDESSPILLAGVGVSAGHIAHAFPTQHIKSPIAIFYGGTDSLVDINMLLGDLPEPVFLKEVAHYEHLSFLWAQEVDTLVYPDILQLLKKYAVFGKDA